MAVPGRLSFKDKPWQCSYASTGARPYTPRQTVLMREVLPVVSVRLPEKPASHVSEVLPGAEAYSAIALEIGFGGGEHLRARAAAEPDCLWVGCEPFGLGVASCLSAMDGKSFPNIRLHHGDGRDVVLALPDAALDAVYILFPDPWPKLRHQKRRIIEPVFLACLRRKIKPNGVLWLATDHEDYAAWMLEQLLRSPDWRWDAATPAEARTPPAGWVTTRYQAKAEKQGRQPWFFKAVPVIDNDEQDVRRYQRD